MAYVVAERSLTTPLSPAQARENIRAGKWCNDMYGVTHCGSVLSPDGLKAVCFYRAPDAEAIRTTSQRFNAPYDRIWSATIHGPVGPDPLTAQPSDAADSAASIVLVQRSFDAPIVFEELEAQAMLHSWCLTLHRVSHLQSFLSTDRRRMLCLFAAPDAEAVRHVEHQMAMAHEIVTPVTICAP